MANELKQILSFNIYLIGVGGQGIGLLSEILLRAIDYAGLPAKGVDTHGLAQRGGIVVSHVRMGKHVYSPLNRMAHADLVIALERHEALRAMNHYLKDGGTLLYYDTVWQPLAVRLNQAKSVSDGMIAETATRRRITVHQVKQDDLPDTRMQNMVLLGYIQKLGLIPQIKPENIADAMADLMNEKMLSANKKIIESVIAA